MRACRASIICAPAAASMLARTASNDPSNGPAAAPCAPGALSREQVVCSRRPPPSQTPPLRAKKATTAVKQLSCTRNMPAYSRRPPQSQTPRLHPRTVTTAMKRNERAKDVTHTHRMSRHVVCANEKSDSASNHLRSASRIVVEKRWLTHPLVMAA